MANSATKQKQSTKSVKKKSPKGNFLLGYISLRLSDARLIPIAILTLGCLYVFIMSIPGVFPSLFQGDALNIFFSPTLYMLIIAAFGMLYIYKSLQRKKIHKYVNVTMIIIFLVLVAGLMYVLTGIGRECVGLFGAVTDCVSWNAFIVAVLIFNPVSGGIFAVLACIGIYYLEPGVRRRIRKYYQ